MRKIVQEIKDQYHAYNQLRKDNKIILKSPIVITTKNEYWEIGSVDVYHSSLKANMSLDVQNSKREEKYSIQLFCNDLTQSPIFRFDSAGPRHRNKGMGGIILEVIDTPHFHFFNEEGKEIAYQSEILKNPKNSEAITKDIDFGISHFCHESNTFLNENNDVPVCGRVQQSLNILSKPKIDYSNIKFDDEL